jgi:MFS family permease
MTDEAAVGGSGSGSIIWYTLFVLTFLNLFSYVDRILIGLMVGPLKATFGMSDTDIGALQGLAFGVSYTIAVLPIGRWVDVGNRTRIIALGGFIFSMSAIGSGLSQNYWELFISRVGVGIGEAAMIPAAWSLIADRVPKERLSSALSIYTVGAFIGIGTAYIVGGTVVGWTLHRPSMTLPFLGELRSWQLAFIISGMPGLLAALWVLTLPEPARKGVVDRTKPELRQVYRHLVDNWRVFLPLFAGFSLITLCIHATNSWTAAFLARVHHLPAQMTGLYLGLLTFVFAIGGIISSGRISDRLFRKGHLDAPVLTATILASLAWLPGWLGPLMPNLGLNLLAFGLREGMVVAIYPLAAASIQLVTPNRLRGQVIAIYMFTISLIGLGLGPTIVGFMSEEIFPGETGIRYSLAWTVGVCLPVAAVLFACTRRPYGELRAAADYEPSIGH